MASFRKKGCFWYYRYTDEAGVKRERKGHWDLATTKGMAASKESEISKIRAGYVDAKTLGYDAHERTPWSDHLADFQKSLLAKGGSQKHAQVTTYRARRVFELAKITRMSELSLSKAQESLRLLRDEGFNQETLNHYIRAVKAFARWLWKDGRTREHLLAHLATSSSEGDRRYVRRALTPEEAARLVNAAEAGPVVMGMSAEDRAMLYLLAFGSGFRANKELRPLTPERFNLDSDPPTVTVKAAYTKNKREAVQPISRALADRLRPWLARKPARKPVFAGMTERTAEMLRVDLEAAGVPYETDSGVVDFHASRVSYITNLVAFGASVKTCQTLARHSTPSLTIGRYAKTTPGEIKGAVESLPNPTSIRPKSQVADLAVTEADGKHMSMRIAHRQPTGDGGNCRDSSDDDVNTYADTPLLKIDSSQENKATDGSCRNHSVNTGGGNRTHTGLPPEDFKSSASAIPPRRLGFDLPSIVAGYCDVSF
jgi:integrase/recombinase XerC